MRSFKTLVIVATAGFIISGCSEFRLPEPPNMQKSKETSDIDNISSKKYNQLTEAECKKLLKMEKEAKEAKKIADEETRVKGRDKVQGSIYFDAANKTAKLNKIYYLTEKLKYCKELGKETIDIDIDKIMEINR
ncbi:Uncharacterised protein [Campylobacter hyointestinalis subsp. hyointestinalis]|uniref:Lipoprotein n=1 Tax=Campylobacter hyointestinalis subsp. hyointestinalis TaxID=91352 RepID=A0A9W5F0B6_CAMHY|nr:hypothetical protein [Campylobacter hyointestinalis]CUU72494.1 Uncharacterised protein [Campylobacter hyointestinalis subsp. hyointestinalis]CUU72495.1 Uncharacterised protein [Campylobacter hyointestinalis subsp. hyointestinalis]CUU84519.1 Uncharacterised protein [Campylobacter hyointestinalis subsp. hyointestinalis]